MSARLPPLHEAFLQDDRHFIARLATNGRQHIAIEAVSERSKITAGHEEKIKSSSRRARASKHSFAPPPVPSNGSLRYCGPILDVVDDDENDNNINMDIQQRSCPYDKAIREESNSLRPSQNLCPSTSYRKKKHNVSPSQVWFGRDMIRKHQKTSSPYFGREFPQSDRYYNCADTLRNQMDLMGRGYVISGLCGTAALSNWRETWIDTVLARTTPCRCRLSCALFAARNYRGMQGSRWRLFLS
jgi:hypothetical protein